MSIAPFARRQAGAIVEKAGEIGRIVKADFIGHIFNRAHCKQKKPLCFQQAALINESLDRETIGLPTGFAEQMRRGAKR